MRRFLFTLGWIALIVAAGVIRLHGLSALGLQHWDEGAYTAGPLGIGPYGRQTLVPFYAPFLFPSSVGACLHWFGASDTVAILCAAVPGILSVAVLGLLATQLFGRSVGMVAALLLATTEYHIAYCRMALTDAPFLFFFLAALALYRRAFDRPKSLWSLGAGYVAGLALLTKYHGGLVRGRWAVPARVRTARLCPAHTRSPGTCPALAVGDADLGLRVRTGRGRARLVPGPHGRLRGVRREPCAVGQRLAPVERGRHGALPGARVCRVDVAGTLAARLDRPGARAAAADARCRLPRMRAARVPRRAARVQKLPAPAVAAGARLCMLAAIGLVTLAQVLPERWRPRGLLLASVLAAVLGVLGSRDLLASANRGHRAAGEYLTRHARPSDRILAIAQHNLFFYLRDSRSAVYSHNELPDARERCDRGDYDWLVTDLRWQHAQSLGYAELIARDHAKLELVCTIANELNEFVIVNHGGFELLDRLRAEPASAEAELVHGIRIYRRTH
ncbi:MAG: glycosyltransferase family 39 protein [Planctomycetota bacterium]